MIQIILMTFGMVCQNLSLKFLTVHLLFVSEEELPELIELMTRFYDKAVEIKEEESKKGNNVTNLRYHLTPHDYEILMCNKAFKDIVKSNIHLKGYVKPNIGGSEVIRDETVKESVPKYDVSPKAGS